MKNFNEILEMRKEAQAIEEEILRYRVVSLLLLCIRFMNLQ